VLITVPLSHCLIVRHPLELELCITNHQEVCWVWPSVTLEQDDRACVSSSDTGAQASTVFVWWHRIQYKQSRSHYPDCPMLASCLVQQLVDLQFQLRPRSFWILTDKRKDTEAYLHFQQDNNCKGRHDRLMPLCACTRVCHVCVRMQWFFVLPTHFSLSLSFFWGNWRARGPYR